MSKTIRNQQTRGFLDKLQRSRKERKEARDLKADELFNIDFLFQELTPAQESQLYILQRSLHLVVYNTLCRPNSGRVIPATTQTCLIK